MLDGIHALLNENGSQGQYGDESSCSGIQHEANDQHPGSSKAHGSDHGIGLFKKQEINQTQRKQKNV